jgi:threonine synthase
VADGFFGIEGISVTVLYPKGRVSPLQERQIAGLGGNISAIAVEGSFDDCQALVKTAFADMDLRKRHVLSSANSINISRLIPQAVYYAVAAGRAMTGRADPDGEATPRNLVKPGVAGGLAWKGGHLTICVPSGNFGNLTAGLYAMGMGAPIRGFIAATNINKTVPDYLATGDYQVRPSQATISNAMDVGAPSNFERMTAHWSYTELSRMIRGVPVTDDETRAVIKAVHERWGYYLDPHGAVGWKAADTEPKNQANGPIVVLATAHPAKFAETVEPLTGPVPVPASLKKVMERKPNTITIPADITALKEVL